MTTKTWNNTSSDDWTTTGDWDPNPPGTPPQAGDDVVIAQGNPQITNENVGTVATVTVSGETSTAELDIVNGTLTTTGAVTLDDATMGVDGGGSSGGSLVTVGGTLTNGGTLAVGNGGLTSASEVDANGGLLNANGYIYIYGNANAGTGGQAILHVAGAAGFDTPGHLTGSVNMAGDALLEFDSGGITNIDPGASLDIDGTQADISIAGDATPNSALTGLAENDGSLTLSDGASLTTSGTGLTNTANIELDSGASLTIGGELTNAAGADITLNGDTSSMPASQLVLDVHSAAGLGTDGHLTGGVFLIGDSLLEFDSGGITQLDANSALTLDGANASVGISTNASINSALTGFADNEGTLSLLDGATVATSAGTNLTNDGVLDVDSSGNSSGSALTVGGGLTNTNQLSIGHIDESGVTTVTVEGASGFTNGSSADLFVTGGSASGPSDQTTLDIANDSAGFGAIDRVIGNVTVTGNALIEFASGRLTEINSNAELTLDGANARVAIAGSTGTDSALTYLADNEGTLRLLDGASVTTSAGTNLTNDSSLAVDSSILGSTGSSLTIGGNLTTTSYLGIGNQNETGDSTVTIDGTSGLTNTATGSIYVTGGPTAGASDQSTLDVANAAAGFGTTGEVTGSVYLYGNALIEFASGGITSLQDADLSLDGANARVALVGSPNTNSALTSLASETSRSTLNLQDGASVMTGSFNDNGGNINVDSVGGTGGSTFNVQGTLTNTSGGDIGIGTGNGNLSATSTIEATDVANAGNIYVDGEPTALAQLVVGDTAGFGTVGTLTGYVLVQSDALVQFASGGLKTINGSLVINGSDAYVAIKGATSSNSALTGLTSVTGSFVVDNGATVGTGALTNSGYLATDDGAQQGGVEFNGFDPGGATLTASGLLTNASAGQIQVGSTEMTANSDLDAGSLANAGKIYLNGGASGLGELNVTGAATDTGSIVAYSDGQLSAASLNIQGGGSVDVAGGAVLAPVTITKGTLELGIGATLSAQPITFAGSSSGTATLTFDPGVQPAPSTAFGNTLANFGANDAIDLEGLTFVTGATATYANGSLTVTSGGVSEEFTLSTPGATTFHAHKDSGNGTIVNTVCFAAGTAIRAVREGCERDVPVDDLHVGDLVVTASGVRRPIRWLGHRRMVCAGHSASEAVMPVRIAADAFGPNRPARDLYVSPAHALCVDVLGEVLIPASSLVNGSTVAQVAVDEITYWHVELDGHDILLADNMPAESYLDVGNRTFFAESDVVGFGAVPDEGIDAAAAAGSCRPFHADGPLVAAVRARLQARAVALGWELHAAPATDLHLVVDGVRIDPVLHDLSARFVVPGGATDVWLMSGSSRPCDIGGGGDRRALGICLAGLSIEIDRANRPIDLGDPRLGVGFHALEDDAWRWTSGRARLPADLWERGRDPVTLCADLAGPTLPRWTAPAASHDSLRQRRAA